MMSIRLYIHHYRRRGHTRARPTAADAQHAWWGTRLYIPTRSQHGVPQSQMSLVTQQRRSRVNLLW